MSALLPKAAAAGSLKAVAQEGGAGAETAIDAKAAILHVRACKDATCTSYGDAKKDLPIGIEAERIDVNASTVETLAVGDGKSVVHARVVDRERPDLAFEALLHGTDVLWSGMTGYTRGSEGDRSGDVVLVVDRDKPTSFVLVAETREDTRICGQASTPLAARGLDPKTMQLRGATLHRLEKKARDEATRIVAKTNTAGRAIAQVVVATGGSAPRAAALTDGNTDTVWSEQRPGDGHGEFVTMRAPHELSLVSLLVTVAPKTPKPDGAAPRTFFIATDDRLYFVTMPEDAWQKAGQTYEIPFPAAVRTTCVAVVLDEAYLHGAAAPEVGIAEVSARTSFDVDAASFDDIAQALGGPRGDEAAALLRRSGNEGLAAVVHRYDSLGDKARALAVDIAASAGACDAAAGDLLTHALTDRAIEVRRRALGRIERCGKAAAPALTSAVLGPDEARRAASAALLASVAPQSALEPLAGKLGEGSTDTRRAIRSAMWRASSVASRDKLLALLARREMTPAARVELLRAIGPKLHELRPEADVALADLFRAAPDMQARYLLVQPLAHLARTPDATEGELSRLAVLARQDPDWQVRARAVELSAGIAPLAATVALAAHDPAPRVREAALRAIAGGSTSSGSGAAIETLAHDEWTFVRVASAEAIGAFPQDRSTQTALVNALEDTSPKVRAAAIVSLGKQRATNQAERVRDRLDDGREDPEVRALAARTLGAMCVQSSADRLTKLALISARPVDAADERIGMAAIEALAALHPSDLKERLGPLFAKNVRPPVRHAAERALAEPGVCR